MRAMVVYKSALLVTESGAIVHCPIWKGLTLGHAMAQPGYGGYESIRTWALDCRRSVLAV